MPKEAGRLFVITIILGWAFDFLFWQKPLGINYALFLTLCLSGGYILLRLNGLRPAKKSLWLLLPFAFFAIIALIRKEPLTSFLAYAFTLFSLGVLASTYLGGRWARFGLADYFHQFLQILDSMLSRLSQYWREVRKEHPEWYENLKSLTVWPVLRGLLISLPILIFFASLLASADLVFNDKVSKFLKTFSDADFFEYVYRFVEMLIVAYILGGIFLHASSKSINEKLLGEEQPLISPSLGFTEASIILSSVIVLFLSFVLIQFRYFFGGETNIGIAGYTYSQYARRGFNELVIVALLSLLLILGLSTLTKRENPRQKHIYSGLSLALTAMVLVILLSSHQRLTLAIDWHGYSRLRLYPRVFLIWVGLLLVTVVILEIFQRERYFAFAAVIASIGFAVSISLTNVDALIVSHNVQRAIAGKHFNVTHLASLSIDAVPALVEEFQDNALPQKVHEGIGAALLCHIYSDSTKAPDNWQSFSFVQWRAEKAIDEVESMLEGYRTTGKGQDGRVRTPGGLTYLCGGEY